MILPFFRERKDRSMLMVGLDNAGMCAVPLYLTLSAAGAAVWQGGCIRERRKLLCMSCVTLLLCQGCLHSIACTVRLVGTLGFTFGYDVA